MRYDDAKERARAGNLAGFEVRTKAKMNQPNQALFPVLDFIVNKIGIKT